MGKDNTQKQAKDVGSDSPASDEATEQTRSGMQGAPRGEGEVGGTDSQPAQSSNRSGPGPEPTARKGYDASNRPSQQGDGTPSPERIAERDSQQGFKSNSGPNDPSSGRGEDEAMSK